MHACDDDSFFNRRTAKCQCAIGQYSRKKTYVTHNHINNGIGLHVYECELSSAMLMLSDQ